MLAVVRVVLDGGIHAFTVQNVALKAGVSHRTVYRYFKTREELLEGLAKWLESFWENSGSPTNPRTIEDVQDTVVPSFIGMGTIRDAFRAVDLAIRTLFKSLARRNRASQGQNQSRR